MSIFIYALIDPRDNQVRYVGKTNNILTRLSNHISNAKKIKHNRHVCNWIKELLTVNLKPLLEVIEECDLSQWSIKESYWIKHYKSIGCNLTNHSTGGESGAAGVVRSDSYKQNLSKVLMGNRRAKGAIRTSETRRKQSENNKRGKAVLTEEEVIKVCQLVNQGLKGRAIKKQVPNIRPHILWNIKNGKSWKHITSKYLTNGNSIS